MTTCSTVLSLVVLPLNTFLFVTLSYGDNVPLNYFSLGITCVIVLAGTAIGLATGQLVPKCKMAMHWVGNMAALASIMCSFFLSSGGSHPDPIWQRDWKFYVSTSMLLSMRLGLVQGNRIHE